MELTVLGATGGTGRQVVRQALDAGHRVTAVVRDPARLPVEHPSLEVLVADVTDPHGLRPALEGRDAVVSALGAHSNRQAREGFVATATRAVLKAMEAAGVRRLAVVSAAPVGPAPQGEGLLLRAVVTPLVRVVFRDVYADLAAMERELGSSGAVDWTVLRPPRLVDKPLTGNYRTGPGTLPGGHSVSRADLAHALLAVLDDPATVGKTVGVAY
ncbi:SDR family oxidoreductase [Streptomyces sp. NPDC059637]|uniref:NAD(P)-dependent oxidoreductase n=1 Tax=Streptomyces TaxID=1883 RepID=UPI0031E14358